MKIIASLLFSALLFFAIAFTSLTLRAETPPNLDDYLAAHPNFSAAMLWQFPVPQQQAMMLKPQGASEGAAPMLWSRLLGVVSQPSLRSYQPDSSLRSPYRVIQVSPPDEKLDNYVDPALYKKLNLKWVPMNTPESPQDPGQEAPPANPPLQGQPVVATQDWSQWPESAKQKLRDDFAAMWAWVETCWPKYQAYKNDNGKPEGFDACFSTAEPANYPPANLQWAENPPNGVSTWTVVPSADAFDLYSQSVALSLVLEMKAAFAWTLAELSAESLKEIFDGTRWFLFVAPGTSEYGIISNEGHLVLTTEIPAPPKLVLSFLAREKMIQGTKQESLIKLFEWERDQMAHTSGGKIMDDCPFKNGGLYWSYKGRAPLSRVINGTVMGCPLYYSDGKGGWVENFDPAVRHWIGGCGGAAGFNQQVLRAINFPAQVTRYGHAQNNFIIDNNVRVWIGHADDTYGQNYSRWHGGEPEIPIAEILIDDATFKSWVVDYDYLDPNLSPEQKTAYAAQNDKAVSKRSIDLMLKYMPKNMLLWHCWYDQGKSHDQTYLFNSYFHLVYGLAELESLYLDYWGSNLPGVWQQIESKVASLGGCDIAWQW